MIIARGQSAEDALPCPRNRVLVFDITYTYTYRACHATRVSVNEDSAVLAKSPSCCPAEVQDHCQVPAPAVNLLSKVHERRSAVTGEPHG